MTVITVLGLGEAGAIYARGLAEAGFIVHGYDPFVSVQEPGVRQFDTIEDAVSEADAVLSFVGARASESVAREAAKRLSPGVVFADCNTGSPELKRALAAVIDAAGAEFADVAILAPVPRAGARSPLAASGPGAARLAELLHPAGAPVDVLDLPAGAAAERKLLRSVFMKGIAAVLLESLAAARATGHAAWLHDQIVTELGGDAEALIERLESGSIQHAERRAHETDDARDFLQSLGTPSLTTEAAGAWLRSLTDNT